MEREALDFHERVAAGYREMAERDTERIVRIDATKSVEEIHAAIIEEVEELIK